MFGNLHFGRIPRTISNLVKKKKKKKNLDFFGEIFENRDFGIFFREIIENLDFGQNLKKISIGGNFRFY